MSVIPAPRREQFRKLNECKNLQEAFETSDFKTRVAESLPRHVSPDRMLRTMIQAANKSPDIYKCDLRQAVGSFLTLSQLGLEPNTPLQHAFLIPFKTKMWNPATKKRDIEGYDLNVVIGYPGLADLAFRSGLVTNIHADVVWPGDEFSFEYGTKAGLRHVPMGKQKDGDEPVWAYAHVGLKDGQAFEVMPWSAVLRVRDNSQGYKAALAQKRNAEDKGWKVPAGYTETPWVKHVVEMAKKTPFRRLAKWLPKSPEMAGALALEEIAERGGRPDFGAIFDGEAIADGVAEQIEYEPSLDAGAAFTLREREAALLTQPQAERQPTTMPKPQPQPQPAEDGDWNGGLPDGMFEEDAAPAQTVAAKHATASAKPAQAGPWYTLASNEGELIAGSQTQDPVKWAHDLLKLCAEAAAAGESDAEIIAANIETIIDVTKASVEAGDLLKHLDLDGAEATVDPLFLAMPMNQQGKPLLSVYVANVKKLAAGLSSMEHLTDWLAANQPTIDALPPASKSAVEIAISEQRVKLQAEASPPASDPTPAAAEDPDARWANGIAADIAKATTRKELELSIGGTAIETRINRLKTDRPDLHKLIGDAYRIKAAELKGGAA